MKTLYVGGNHFINRFSSLKAAVGRADDDDIIEICKDLKDVDVKVTKNITINGNGHLIMPASGQSAITCCAYTTINNVRFECPSRTTAVKITNGGVLKNIKTEMIGPLRAIYPTVVQMGGTLTIEDSIIMGFENYKSHGTNNTVTFFKGSELTDYYRGAVYLDDDNYYMSKFRELTAISDSVISCALFDGNCRIIDSTLKNFNRAMGIVLIDSCTIAAQRVENHSLSQEPKDGPLKDWNRRAIPFALHITGAKVTVENYRSDMSDDCIGFYMTSGALDIRSSGNKNSNMRHLIKGGAVVFNNVDDNGFYEIRGGRCSVMNSNVRTSSAARSAMKQLDDMIGLQGVKKQLHTIMNTISVNMRYPEKNFGFSHHMVFAGDPGTGKTTVAKLVAQALFEIGAIPENKYMEVSASQLVKGYVGQTGEHVEEVMKKALGGVLFIDEAYELMVKENQNTFNNDAIAVILRYMEDHRDELVVIAAGYEKEMREFLASNVGLTRRFQWVSFDDYSAEEMRDIFLAMCRQYKENFCFDGYQKELRQAFNAITNFYLGHPDAKGRITNGGNGGLVRNVFQQVVFSRNNRVAEHMIQTMQFTQDDLRTAFHEEMKKALNVTMGTRGF